METENRAIRVFVSSTFLDMQRERDELAKHVFPQLRKMCTSRGVVLTEVDLRWGVTDEQRAEGRVLPLCLAEIDDCRPFFIAMLGERYGWEAGEIPPDLLAREPWLSTHHDSSITELEILHGVLNDPVKAAGSFFYFRDPKYVDRLPPQERGKHLEVARQGEIERFGVQEAERRAEQRRRKLLALKQRIRASGRTLCESYEGPEELGRLVLNDLRVTLDALYPEEARPHPLDREAAEHEAYADSRRHVYVARPEYLHRLDAHAAGDGPPLVFLGAPGSGKSALLANWMDRYRRSHPNEFVLAHFISATTRAADWAAMLRRILGELGRRFEIEEEVPDTPEALRAAFSSWLQLASARGKVVLLLDALDQLADSDGAPDLVWLPSTIPPNVRLVVSTLPGRPLTALRDRGWPTMRIQPLDPRERQELLTGVLAGYRKALATDRIDRITHAPQTESPLFLRSLMEELRLWGDHYTLDRQIHHYLAAPTVAELYTRILARYEADYERDRPGLVRDAMTRIWATRRGVAESELLAMLGSDGETLPYAAWSPLHVASEGLLTVRSGLINFAHAQVREAVENRYLPRGKDRALAHLAVADHFQAHESTPRAIEELPWQLAMAGAWGRLYDLLTDVTFLYAASQPSRHDVRSLWTAIEANSDLRLVAAYRPLLEHPERYDTVQLHTVAVLLREMGHPPEALTLQKRLAERAHQNRQPLGLPRALGEMALIAKDMGRSDEAIEMLVKLEGLHREVGDLEGLEVTLGNRAALLAPRVPESALALFREQERICRELGRLRGLAACLGNQAPLLMLSGDFEAAVARTLEQERLGRQLGDPTCVAAALQNRAVIRKQQGDLAASMTLTREAEALHRQLGEHAGLARCVFLQADLHTAMGDARAAAACYEEAARLARLADDPEQLAAALEGEATGLVAQERFGAAVPLMREVEALRRRLGDPRRVATCLGGLALVLQRSGDVEAATDVLMEQAALARELGDQPLLARNLHLQGTIQWSHGNREPALSLHREQERVSRDLGDLDGVVMSLARQAEILTHAGDMKALAALYTEEARVHRESGDTVALATCLGRHAPVLARLGKARDALALLREQERICRQAAHLEDLQMNLGMQADILASGGRAELAVKILSERLYICEQLGDVNWLAWAMGHLGYRVASSDRKKGKKLLEESVRLAARHGHPEWRARLQEMLDRV